VVGPDQVPVITDLDTARRTPELAVLSALAHGAEPNRTPIFEALFAALDVIEHDHAKLYTDLVFALLPPTARADLEQAMTTTSHKYISDYARHYYSEGEAQGKAEGRAEGKVEGSAAMLLDILDARGIEVPDAVRSDIAGCTDLDRLKVWARRASTARKVQDLDDRFAQ
jgi:hypothetical protein